MIGREAELASLERVVGGGPAGGAMIVIGEPGIGKSTLWDVAVGLARARGIRVLCAQSSGSEARLPFAGLIDLLESVGDAELEHLPPPQRQALEVALLRAAPGEDPAQSTAIAIGLLGLLRSAAAKRPVLVAIDDLQWLDQPSAEAIAFAAQRVRDAGISFLLTRRAARIGAVERVLARHRLERLNVSGLSVGAMRRLLLDRLGLTVSRQLLRRIVDVAEGNPLFALEIGRSLVESGTPDASEEIPLPDTVEEMFGARVARLPGRVRRVLLAVALSADPTAEQVAAVTEPGALEAAIDAGVATVDGNRVRASHPLLAAAARSGAGPRERRELHLALAEVAREEQLRVLHEALATTGPDSELAGRLIAAADDARSRGAREQAALLASHALRLTPSGSADRADRVLMLAERLDEAGEVRQATTLLDEELPDLPAGTLLARALLLLGDGVGVTSIKEQQRYLERALDECGEDLNMRAYLLAKMADNDVVAGVRRLRESERLVLEAAKHATEAPVVRYTLHALAWPRAFTGRPVDDLCERSRVADDPSAYISATPERVAGKRLMWRGELEAARELFRSLSELADERGELTSYAMLRLHLCELALRAGDLEWAGRLLDEWAESSDFETQFRPQYHRCRALLAAQTGDPGGTARWASEACERAAASGCRFDELEARRASGIAALLEQAPERALEDLRPVWEHCEREGVLEPGAFPVAPELVQALVEVGDLAAAREVTERLAGLAETQDHPWARATARRCHAQIALATDQRDAAAAAGLREAAGELEALGFRFDAARCLLDLGRALRRAKQWRSARESLEDAATSFERLRSSGWAELARAELARVGARRPGASDELTPTESRVTELAAEGLANKEIAAALYVTVNTVEVHLSRAYAKLGVRSRSQLAKALAARR